MIGESGSGGRESSPLLVDGDVMEVPGGGSSVPTICDHDMVEESWGDDAVHWSGELGELNASSSKKAF
jgi:hypothetical protein